jgi:putative SOS response-associated peptidase YedK
MLAAALALICNNPSMCGRFRLSRRKQVVEEYFDVCSELEDWNPFYNIAPTRFVPVIRQHPKEPRRDLSLLRWGLIPSWAKDSGGAANMINARSETAAALPAFREPLRFRRCLVPADGFYEWKRSSRGKQPFCFVVNDGELFAFAAVWDRWREPDGQWTRSFSILTTTANHVTAPVHDRMPVILAKQDFDLWLDPGMGDVNVIAELLKPYDPSWMRCYPVSDRVNHVQNDDAECAAPIHLGTPPQGQLFG